MFTILFSSDYMLANPRQARDKRIMGLAQAATTNTSTLRPSGWPPIAQTFHHL